MSLITKIGGGFLAIVFGGSYIASLVKDDTATRRPTVGPPAGASIQPIVSTAKPELYNAAKLVKEYQNNEVAADNKYKGKRLRAVGVLGSIAKDITDDAYVTIGNGFSTVNCYFDNNGPPVLAELNKGDGVVVEGDCHGFTMGDVILRHCSIPTTDQLKADHPELFATSTKPKKRRHSDDGGE